MTKDEMIQQKEEFYKKLKCNCRKLKVITQMKVDLENLISYQRSKYHQLDHALALQDGRLVKLREDGRIYQPQKPAKELLEIMKMPLHERLAIANALKDLQEGLLQ